MKRRVIEKAVEVIDRIAPPRHVIALRYARRRLATGGTLGAGRTEMRTRGIFMMSAESERHFIRYKLRRGGRTLLDQIFCVRIAVAAEPGVLGDWREPASRAQPIELIQPGRRRAGIPNLELMLRLLTLRHTHNL